MKLSGLNGCNQLVISHENDCLSAKRFRAKAGKISVNKKLYAPLVASDYYVLSYA